MIIAGIFSILMPAGASLHWGVLWALRFVVGLVHGVIWPSMTVIMSHWAPPNERGKLIGFMNAGRGLGLKNEVRALRLLAQVLKLVMLSHCLWVD